MKYEIPKWLSAIIICFFQLVDIDGEAIKCFVFRIYLYQAFQINFGYFMSASEGLIDILSHKLTSHVIVF